MSKSTRPAISGLIALTCIAVLVLARIGPRSTDSSRRELVLAMSQFKITFDKDGTKKYTPGDGKVWILHPDENWRKEQISIPDSKAIQKATAFDIDGDGNNELIVAGGNGASIKWFKRADGSWHGHDLWKPPLVRVRDIEFGDLDGDGEAELAVATHDRGGIYVFDRQNGKWTPQQVYGTKTRTYVHEIEIGDVDGNGRLEFYATPSQPNVDVGFDQPGKIVKFEWDGTSYKPTVVRDFKRTHAKEILVADIDDDGRDELLISIQGLGKKSSTAPMGFDIEIPATFEMVRWTDGKEESRVIGTVGALQCRTVVAGDANNDGDTDLVVGSRYGGLYVFLRKGNEWTRTSVDKDSTGAVHAVTVADVDGDGRNEIVSASDDTDTVDMYRWQDGRWAKQKLVGTPSDDWVWTIEFLDVDNEN